MPGTGEYEGHLEISDRWYGDDRHLEMAFEDAVAHPLVGSQDYNDQWQDAAFDEAQEYAYEESLYDEDNDG